MIDNVALSELAGKTSSPITLITGLKYNTSLIKIFNNLTFLYDPNWEYEQGNPTYPIAFFYVKSMTDQMSSEVSQKPMLFYNTAADTNDATKGGVTNIVADNIILKPKTYKMDIIVPANDSTFQNSSFSFESVASVEKFIFDSNGRATMSSGQQSAVRIANNSISIIKTLLKGLYGTSIGAASIINMLLQQQDYNKASIEYMWQNRRILKMKVWNGWKFKYLVIKDCDITKTGENGDYYEGTLTCQEVPILTFRKQEASALSIMSRISSALGVAQKAVTKAFISAMSATLGE